MLIYHGTTKSRLKKILRSGIQPRSATGDKGNWDAYPSIDDMAYLSTTYPGYFAAASSPNLKNLVIVEIDTDMLDEENFYPDEDFIAQNLAQSMGVPLNEVHDQVKEEIWRWKTLWQDSIDHIGNLAHRGTVPPEAITRVVTINGKERPHIVMTLMDPTITMINHKIMGWKYHGMLRWLFGDDEILPQAEEAKRWGLIPGEGDEESPFKDSEKFWLKESRDRTGIEVLVPEEAGG